MAGRVLVGRILTCSERVNCVSDMNCDADYFMSAPVKPWTFKHLPDKGILTDLNYGEGVVIITNSK